MIFKNFQDEKISALGFGAMRLPCTDGKIDEAAVAKMVKTAMDSGINYYDTAWGYHDGNSELVMGKTLGEYTRENFFLASKFPGYDLANMPKVKEIFEKQLQKCRVDFFDFYLFHNVCEMNINEYLDPKFGIYDFLIEQKKNGRIKHLGFSCHGELDVLERFLEAYGSDMEFCQLQINWLDWTFQHGKEKVALLQKYKIPLWVMEPLRGGSLCKLPESAAKKLGKLRPNESATAWAFRFLQGIGATVILSGMSNQEQLEQNIATFAQDKPLNEMEERTLAQIAKDWLSADQIPCTACRYCTSHCPQNLDIPKIISLYNEHNFTVASGQWDFISPMYFSGQPKEAHPLNCVSCRSCEKVCPQQIKIADVMSAFAKVLG